MTSYWYFGPLQSSSKPDTHNACRLKRQEVQVPHCSGPRERRGKPPHDIDWVTRSSKGDSRSWRQTSPLVENRYGSRIWKSISSNARRNVSILKSATGFVARELCTPSCASDKGRLIA